jgi:YfiR/HmsC-like
VKTPITFCVLVSAALLLIEGDLPAQVDSSKEYRVKAVFVYNFAHFIAWPPNAFSTANAPIVIGVLGDEPFASDLDQLVRGETANNHPLVVQRYQEIGQIKTCHILFVSRSVTKQLEEILANLRSRSVLTVGDSENFAQRGGMIRLVTENNKIRFRVNVEAAKAANLTISSKLLRAAEIVEPKKG